MARIDMYQYCSSNKRVSDLLKVNINFMNYWLCYGCLNLRNLHMSSGLGHST